MDSEMKLQHLAAFRAIMLTGKISGASEILGRSQPAVSRILDKFEFELGMRLFERRKGQITPTPEAYLLLEEVERAYLSLDSLRAFASRLLKGEGRGISLAVMPALGINFVPGILSRFRADWADTKVIINVRMSLTIEEWAATQQIDLGLAEVPLRRSGFTTEVFSNSPYIAALPKGHPLEDRASIGPSDLTHGPFIYWTTFLPGRHQIDQVLNAAGVKIDPAYETTYSATALEMVKNGIGMAIIDPYTAVLQRDDRVVLVPFRPAVPFNVGLLRPNSRPAGVATQALLELLFQERDRVLELLPN